jgi:hypothetical protein
VAPVRPLSRWSGTRAAALTLAVSGALAAGGAAGGCSSVESAYCEAKCDCEGCSAQRLDECIVKARAEFDKAAVFHCEDLYERYLDCWIDNPVCVGSRFERPSACEDLRRRADDCYDGRRIRIDLRGP